MTPAIEVMQLPSAKLTDDEIAAAQKLESEIDKYIHDNIRYRGCDYAGRETNQNVISLVLGRIDEAGYNAECTIVFEKHRLNAALQQPVGFTLRVSPKAEIYRKLNSQYSP